MKSLIFRALVVAAVVAPSAALGHEIHGRDQIVMGDAYQRALSRLERFKQEFQGAAEDLEMEDEGGDLETFESDLFASDDAGQEEEEEGEWEDGWTYLEHPTEDFADSLWDVPKPPHFPPGGEHRLPGEDKPHPPHHPKRPPGHHHPHHPHHPHPHPHPPHHPPPHKHFPWPPHWPPRHHKPIYTRKTIYELVSESKHTTKAFEIIKNDEVLTALFKDPNVNITFFVPTNEAFEHLPPRPPPEDPSNDPSKEFHRKAVLYHTSPEAYNTRKLWLSKTIPSGIKSEAGFGEGSHQRLRVGFNPLSGMRVNFLSKITCGNIYATNGIIHGVNHFIDLPIDAGTLIGVVPTVFSTSALAFAKMELAGEPPLPEGPKTFFIPANSAWKALGYKVNAWLFSTKGEKYLAALMKYHVTHPKVVYSNYVLVPDTDESSNRPDHYHAELATFLGDKNITVDIWRRGHWAKWVINDKIITTLTDIITRDGVLHIPSRVLIPPHHHHKEVPEKPFEPFSALDEEGEEGEEDEQFMGGDGEITVEELKARLEPYL